MPNQYAYFPTKLMLNDKIKKIINLKKFSKKKIIIKRMRTNPDRKNKLTIKILKKSILRMRKKSIFYTFTFFLATLNRHYVT
jgi:hypothetical protein